MSFQGALSFLFIAIRLISIAKSNPTTGPFEVLLKDVSHCPESSKGVEYDYKLQRLSRKNVNIRANVSVNVLITDDFDISANLAKQTNQGWKENFFLLEVPKACQVVKTFVPSLDRDLAEQMNGHHCPWPLGNYTVNIPLRWEMGVLPVFPYGKYRTKVNVLTKQRKRVFCIFGFVEVIPKKSVG